MNSRHRWLLVGPCLLSFLCVKTLHAQHCPPIVESYLSSTTVARVDDGLKWTFSYTKTGGRSKEAYQYYLIAFAERHRKQIAELTPQEAISRKLATILDTNLAKRTEDGTYSLELKINTEQFVDAMKSDKQIADDRTTDLGGWKSFDDEIRLAVFIPFLDDQNFSVLEGLPDDKHECNYRGDSALLFETISHRMKVCFGIVQAVRIADGQFYLQINGNRPASEDAQ